MTEDLPSTQVDRDISRTQGDKIPLQSAASTRLVVDNEEESSKIAQMKNLVEEHLVTNERSRLRPPPEGADIGAHDVEEHIVEPSLKPKQTLSISTRSTSGTPQEHSFSSVESSTQVFSSMQPEDPALSSGVDISMSLPVNVENTLGIKHDHTIAQVALPLVGVPFNQIALRSHEDNSLNNEEHGVDDTNLDEFPPSSLPASSSPPQLFSSSPHGSSQSSHIDTESADMTDIEGKEMNKTPHDYPQGDDKMPDVANERGSQLSELLICHKALDCATPVVTVSLVENGSRKRVEYDNNIETCPSQPSPPSKRVKLNPGVDQPPVPKRATLSSQYRQFKKLALPFCPPLKIDNGSMREHSLSRNDEQKQRELAMQSQILRHKVPATKISRSNIQFKSPLINPSAVLADAPTIRLTPAVQTLERKLQLLKRAIRVKEEDEENVLLGLTNKWLEAGREIAFEVWEIVRNCGDSAEVTSLYKSRNWEEDCESKVEESNDEFRGHKVPSGSIMRTMGSIASEEDLDAPHNTLGIMLRQLGIAPETLGWDEDKELFID